MKSFKEKFFSFYDELPVSKTIGRQSGRWVIWDIGLGEYCICEQDERYGFLFNVEDGKLREHNQFHPSTLRSTLMLIKAQRYLNEIV
jgi:hypothetical protein